MATNITVRSTVVHDANRNWLQFEANGVTGPVGRASGVINYALFTANTHYPNGFIPSGTMVGRVTVGGKLGPYDNAASDGRETAVGFLYNNEVVPTNTAEVASVPFIDCFAVVIQSKLPTNSGNDANGRLDLPLIKFRA